jgi:hypothetical protein
MAVGRQGYFSAAVSLGRARKMSPSPEFDPRTVQTVASRYTDWAIQARSAATEAEIYQRGGEKNPRSWQLIAGQNSNS